MEIRSLTSWLKVLKAKQWDFFGTGHFRDKSFNPKTVNPAPDFIYQKRLWLHLGTFVDYMVRKFFRDLEVAPHAEIIEEDYLIAEISLNLLCYKDPVRGFTLFFGSTPEEAEQARELYQDGLQWIKSYQQKNWQECLQDTWLMASLDRLYREMVFPTIPLLSDQEVNQLERFLSRIFEWLQSAFSSAKKVYLNPTLGVENLIKADADLIIDDTLWDIKTTKDPKKAPFQEVNQLLGYVSLIHYHNKNSPRKFPEISAVGFLFPQQLACWQLTLDDFAVTEREAMIEKIRRLRDGFHP